MRVACEAFALQSGFVLSFGMGVRKVFKMSRASNMLWSRFCTHAHVYEGATYMPHFREARPVKQLEKLKTQMLNRLEDRHRSDMV